MKLCVPRLLLVLPRGASKSHSEDLMHRLLARTDLKLTSTMWLHAESKRDSSCDTIICTGTE
eukprot:scaffold163720_cov17-Tisochrysis_lutea.AAC.1